MRCVYCEAPLPEGAMFCGECGSAVHPGRADDEAARTPSMSERADVAAGVATGDQAGPPVDAVDIDADDIDDPTGTEQDRESIADATEVTDASDVETPPSLPDESTRFAERRAAAIPFTLHFSTGETVSVAGSGLVGRRPAAQPGEYFDEYVVIDDPGRSVSKTHLEFGQDGGAFWVSDRFSANGTVLREPDRAPRLCPGGRRTRVARGSRIDIGEQFFLVV